MEEKVSESMKKRARPTSDDVPQGDREAKQDDGQLRSRTGRQPQYRDRDVYGLSESQPSSTNDLMTEYRLLLARQDALQEQIRLVESKLSLRRLESTMVGSGLSARDSVERTIPSDNSILELAREDLLRRERQSLLESGRSAYGLSGADPLRLLQERRDRELLISRLSGNPGQSFPDRFLSLDQQRRVNMPHGGLPPSMETLDDLLAARSRGSDRYAGLLQSAGLPRSRLDEASGRGSPQRHTMSSTRFDSDALGPGDQLQILQQIERQRRINESLLDQARGRDLGSARPPALAAASHGAQLRDMRGSPAGRDFKVGVAMASASDAEKLSAFQALIRRSLEYFEATEDDVLTSVQGRRQKIRLGQSTFGMPRTRLRTNPIPSVGVRCKYCSHLPIRSMARAKGAVYYPKTMISVYQGKSQKLDDSSLLTHSSQLRKTLQILTSWSLAILCPRRSRKS